MGFSYKNDDPTPGVGLHMVCRGVRHMRIAICIIHTRENKSCKNQTCAIFSGTSIFTIFDVAIGNVTENVPDQRPPRHCVSYSIHTVARVASVE